MSENTAPYNHDRAQHAREEAVWAPLSPAERRQWSRGLFDFRPNTATPMTNHMLQSMMNHNGVISLESWVLPVRAFDRAGFSAQDWLEIMTSLHVLLATHPDTVTSNPAVTMQNRTSFISHVAIEPEAWAAWLPLRRAGNSALSATRAVLRAATVEEAPPTDHEGSRS